MSKIIYLQENGVVAVINPLLNDINPATNKIYTIEEIAKKDVPTGLKYKIVNTSDIPTDRSFRNAWYAEEADLTDGVGS